LLTQYPRPAEPANSDAAGSPNSDAAGSPNSDNAEPTNSDNAGQTNNDGPGSVNGEATGSANDDAAESTTANNDPADAEPAELHLPESMLGDPDLAREHPAWADRLADGGWRLIRRNDGTFVWVSPLGRRHVVQLPPVAPPLPPPQPRPPEPEVY
jgi:hypothetical protein